MKHDVVDAVAGLLREKGIDRETFQEIIESVFFSMIKRKFGESDNFSVTFNPDKGDIEIQCLKMVVADDVDPDPATEVCLKVAKGYDPYAEVGEETVVMIDYEEEFGRRIITSAKQHLVQRIRERLDRIAIDPYAHYASVTKLQNRPGYRLRVGEWRVIYEIEGNELVILVLRVGSRGEVYR